MHMFKRFAVTIVGVGLLVLGAAMMVLPGPGILVIVGGLALLATEYVWARRMLKTAQAQAEKVQDAAVASPVRTASTVLFGVALLVLGVAMVVLRDVDLPFWSPVTGGILAVTALILLATTYLTLRAAKGGDTTYTPTGPNGQGSARISSARR
jgi:drug/metabolite transporter (DMT)-like permease